MQQSSPSTSESPQQVVWPRTMQQPLPGSPWQQMQLANNFQLPSQMTGQPWTGPFRTNQYTLESPMGPAFYSAQGYNVGYQPRGRPYYNPVMMPYAAPQFPRSAVIDNRFNLTHQSDMIPIPRHRHMIPGSSDGFFRSSPRPKMNPMYHPRQSMHCPRGVANTLKQEEYNAEQRANTGAPMKSSGGYSGGIMFRPNIPIPTRVCDKEFLSKQYEKERFREVYRRENVDLNAILPSSTTEAVMYYIDYLLMENKQSVLPLEQLRENAPPMSYEELSSHPYAFEILNRRTELPTKNFIKWLKHFDLKPVLNETTSEFELVKISPQSRNCSPRASTPKTAEVGDNNEDILRSSVRAAGLQTYTPQLSPVPDNQDSNTFIRYSDQATDQGYEPQVSSNDVPASRQNNMRKITVIKKGESAESTAAFVEQLSMLPKQQQDQFLAGESSLYQQFNNGVQTTYYHQPTTTIQLPSIPEAISEQYNAAPVVQERVPSSQVDAVVHERVAQCPVGVAIPERNLPQEPDSTTSADAVRLPPIETLTCHPQAFQAVQERESGSSDLSDVDEHIMPALIEKQGDSVESQVTAMEVDPACIVERVHEALAHVASGDLREPEEAADGESVVITVQESSTDGENIVVLQAIDADDNSNTAFVVTENSSVSDAAAAEATVPNDVEEIITVYASGASDAGKTTTRKAATRRNDGVKKSKMTRAKRQADSDASSPKKRLRKRSK